MIPADLLDQLREKDPELWEKIARGLPIKPYGQYFAYADGKQIAQKFDFSFIPFGELLLEVALAWLQYCLQAAIRARGWRFVLMTSNGCPFAKIYKNDICPTPRCNGYGDTEAEALLRAYLAAII